MTKTLNHVRIDQTETLQPKQGARPNQGTHKPLVSSSNLDVATDQKTGEKEPMTRIISPVAWLSAPDWLTVSEACELSGHDEATIYWLIQDGAVEARHGDCWLIEKTSLRELQESLQETLLALGDSQRSLSP